MATGLKLFLLLGAKILLLLLRTGLPAAATPATPAAQLTPADLLVVFGMQWSHLGLLEISRIWRMGVRAHIIFDDQADMVTLHAAGAAHGESFSATADLPGLSPTLRHVLAPVLAHKATNGSYKWMLLGDADTFWSIPAVLEMLQAAALPHTHPVVLSDFLIHCRTLAHNTSSSSSSNSSKQNYMEAKIQVSQLHHDGRCAPCGTHSSTDEIRAASCPCKLQASWVESEVHRTQLCPWQGRTSFYGGTGVIYSAGLLHSILQNQQNLVSYYDVAHSRFSEYSDLTMSEALRRMGIGFTQPPQPPVLEEQKVSRTGGTVAEGGGSESDQARRLFGMYSRFNDEASPNETYIRHKEAAAAEPHVFRHLVSAHVRQHSTKLGPYLSTMRDMAELLAASSTPPPPLPPEAEEATYVTKEKGKATYVTKEKEMAT